MLPAGGPAGWERWTAPAAVLACLLWSSAFVGVKIGLRYMPPLTFAGVRFVVSGLLLAPFWAGRVGAGREILRNWRLVALVAGLQTVVLYGAFFVGMTMIGGAQGAILLGAYPLMAAVLAHFTMDDDRLGAGKIVSIALGLAGVAVISLASRPWEPAGLRQLGGIALLLVGILSSAVANIVAARSRGAMNPVLLTSVQMALGGAVLLAAAGATESVPMRLPPWQFLAAMFYLASVSAVGFTIWYALLRHVKVSRLNMWRFVIPVFGAGLSWMLLPGESPDVASVAGVVCVAAAVVLSHRQAASESAVAGPVG